MKVHITTDDIVEGKCDQEGRKYLGKEYADKEVELAILDVREPEEDD